MIQNYRFFDDVNIIEKYNIIYYNEFKSMNRYFTGYNRSPIANMYKGIVYWSIGIPEYESIWLQ
jgi:hypothetical protein